MNNQSEIQRIKIALKELEHEKRLAMQKIFKKSTRTSIHNAITIIVSVYALCMLENIGSSQTWFYINVAKTTITSMAIAVGIAFPSVQEIAWNCVLIMMLVQVGLIVSAPFLLGHAMDAQLAMYLILANKAIGLLC